MVMHFVNGPVSTERVLARIDTAVLEHEGVDLLAMGAQRLDGTRASPDKVAHGLMTFVGDPDRRELAGPQ